jgi:serralysin
MFSFFPYGDGFNGGVNVAAGDLNGDGVDEIVTGPGAASLEGHECLVFYLGGIPGSGSSSTFLWVEKFRFMVTQHFRSEVRVATADLDGDGRAEIITGSGEGDAPIVGVFEGTTGASLGHFFASDPTYRGGLFVAGIAVTRRR